MHYTDHSFFQRQIRDQLKERYEHMAFKVNISIFGEYLTLKSLERRGQTSMHTQKPVRVIRGSGAQNWFSPPIGYTYAGLYRVTEVCEPRASSILTGIDVLTSPPG